MIKISQNLLAALLNYLKTKPYEEVFFLIGALTNCKACEEVKNAKMDKVGPKKKKEEKGTKEVLENESTQHNKA